MGNPKSFKISIHSPLARTLKSSVSQKLLEFLGNYYDDVLAEYITVLICNGKNQNEVQDDLEAFLGDRSEEFVSWLWVLLLDYVDQSKTSLVPLGHKAVSVSSPHEHDDMDCRAEGSRNLLDNNGTSNGNGSLTTGEQLRHPSTHISYTLSADVGFQRSEKVSLLVPGNDMQSKPEPVEDNYDDFLDHESSRKDSFMVVMPTSGEERIQKIDDSKAIDMPKELLSPSKQLYPGRLLSSFAENSLPRRTSPANAYRSRLSPEVVTVSLWCDKPRVSVWDRLGKPHETHVSTTEQDGRGLNQSVQESLPSEGHKEGIPGLGNGLNNPGKYKKLEEGGVSGNGKLIGATTIRRKRDFGESTTGSGNSSVPLVSKGNMEIQHKETSGDPKRSKLAEEISEPTTATQKMSDLKIRFQELEREICKLRSKRTGMTRGGKSDLSSGSGALKHPGEDIKSRTIYVTNVHFAATKEAISNHFSKCGLVVNVVILTDERIVQPNRSALITFASLESVNKALALSGTSFFSRTVKVFRKADMATGNSAPPQVVAMPMQARFSPIKRKTAIDRPLHPSHHLQWRRESVSNSSEQSSSANTQAKESVPNHCEPSASAKSVQEKE